jgi:hypothetical protein
MIVRTLFGWQAASEDEPGLRPPAGLEKNARESNPAGS